MPADIVSRVKQYITSMPVPNYTIIAFYIASIFIVLLINQLNILIQINTLPKLKVKTITPASLPILDTEVSSISAKSYAVYDVTSRTFIKTHNHTLRFSPASTTKIMTALVALETYNVSDIIDASVGAQIEGSRMGIYTGENLRVLDLLYGLLLPSGNDAAYVLASHYDGGVQGFVNRMNEKSKELYMYNTNFKDASGYDDRNYTTAQDLARLAAHALSHPIIREIVKTKDITFTDPTGNYIHKITNLNKLLEIEGVTGMKTGFTEEAGGVLVTTYQQDGREYVFVVLKSNDRFADTMTLIHAVRNGTIRAF